MHAKEVSRRGGWKNSFAASTAVCLAMAVLLVFFGCSTDENDDTPPPDGDGSEADMEPPDNSADCPEEAVDCNSRNFTFTLKPRYATFLPGEAKILGFLEKAPLLVAVPAAALGSLLELYGMVLFAAVIDNTSGAEDYADKIRYGEWDVESEIKMRVSATLFKRTNGRYNVHLSAANTYTPAFDEEEGDDHTGLYQDLISFSVWPAEGSRERVQIAGDTLFPPNEPEEIDISHSTSWSASLGFGTGGSGSGDIGWSDEIRISSCIEDFKLERLSRSSTVGWISKMKISKPPEDHETTDSVPYYVDNPASICQGESIFNMDYKRWMNWPADRGRNDYNMTYTAGYETLAADDEEPLAFHVMAVQRLMRGYLEGVGAISSFGTAVMIPYMVVVQGKVVVDPRENEGNIVRFENFESRGYTLTDIVLGHYELPENMRIPSTDPETENTPAMIDLSVGGDDGKEIWAVADGGRIWMYSQDRDVWVALRHPTENVASFRQVSIGDGGTSEIWAVAGGGGMWKYAPNEDTSSLDGDWISMGSRSFVKVSAGGPGGSEVWAIEEGGNAYRYDFSNETWENKNTDDLYNLRDISVGGPGGTEVWATAAGGGAVWRYDSASGEWEQKSNDTSFWKIAVGGTETRSVWGIADFGAVWQYDFDTSSWVSRSDPENEVYDFIDLSLGGDDGELVIAVANGGTIWRYDVEGRDWHLSMVEAE